MRWIEKGKNVFVTGSPGRGKSSCMSNVISELYGKGTQLIVTGCTGAAAVNIGHEALEELSDPRGVLRYISDGEVRMRRNC